MLDYLLSILAPHHCYSCQKAGGVLCQSCKYNIASEAAEGCVVCGKAAASGVCRGCRTTYSKAWCAGSRSGELEQLINDYKFERVKAAHVALADLLDAVLPLLPSNVVVVPVPTIPTHIRQRGYDHAALVARRLAKLRKLPYQPVVRRQANTKQRGASRKDRFQQAKVSFGCKGSLPANKVYLLIDDVITTGATMQYAAKALHDAGASDVWVAAIARQPLDKPRLHLLK